MEGIIMLPILWMIAYFIAVWLIVSYKFDSIEWGEE
jgi:hypothetical protein